MRKPRRSLWRPSPQRILAVTIVAVAAILVGLLAASTGTFLSSAKTPDRPVLAFVIAASLWGTAIISYVAWPNRWNLYAHGQLAFGFVAYFLPIGAAGVLDRYPEESVSLYARLLLAGFFVAVAGVFIGKAMASARSPESVPIWSRIDLRDSDRAARRTRVALVLACVGTIAAFAMMGFVPMLAEDAFAAKFFRGAYAASYRPVAPLYRLSTSVIALLLPIATMYALRRRRENWGLVSAIALAIMFLTLQRGPAVTGILLFVGVLFAARRRGMWFYVAALVTTYFLGSGLYQILGRFGLGPLAGGRSVSLVDGAVAGAPDVQDQLAFVTRWLARPTYTSGRTFVGGLIPGSFEWNPAIWSLSVTNPGADVSEISSGGYRLPPQLWGLVSFGWSGVVVVSALYGVAVGYLAGRARRTIVLGDPEKTMIAFVVYGAVVDLVTHFYTLAYLSVIELVVLLFLFRLSRGLSDASDAGRGFRFAGMVERSGAAR